jgi:predicted N-acetyltransferase YhbS
MNTSAPGQILVRPATPADLPRVIAAADAVFRSPPVEGLHSMGHDYPLLFSSDNASHLLIAEDGAGELLAHAGFVLRAANLHGTEVPVATIGSVFTRPDQRQRGLATQVLAAAVESARRAGALLGMVSGHRGLYERAGFAPYPACPRYWVPAAGADAEAAELAIAPYTDDALNDVMALSAREPVHFVRSVADWKRLLGAKVLFFEPAEMFLIRRAGRVVAYLALGRPNRSTPDARDPVVRSARVLELAGDRAAIAAAVSVIAHQLGVTLLEVLLPPSDSSLADQAAARGWQTELAQLPFTAAWWDPAMARLPLPFYGFNYV